MRRLIVRLGIALVVVGMLAVPAVNAQGRSHQRGRAFGQCVSDCVRAGGNGAACVAICLFGGGGGGGNE